MFSCPIPALISERKWMLPALRQWLLPAFVLGAVLAGSMQPSQAAAVRMASHIAFARPAEVSSPKDINFGNIRTFPNDIIRINVFGSMWLNDEWYAAALNHRRGMIIFNDPTDQMMNFFISNYRPGQSIMPLKAMCSLNGTSGSDCASMVYDSMTQGKTVLHIGLSAMVTDTTSAPGTSSPSFDMCVIYQ